MLTLNFIVKLLRGKTTKKDSLLASVFCDFGIIAGILSFIKNY